MPDSIKINGIEVPAGTPIEQALAETKAERYLIVKDGKPETEIMWDGKTPYTPETGTELVASKDWKGEAYAGPPEPAEAKAKRTADERLDTQIGSLRDDLRGFDAMTANQRANAQKRALRTLLLLARTVRGDFAEDTE